jgi:hypothetical protein
MVRVHHVDDVPNRTKLWHCSSTRRVTQFTVLPLESVQLEIRLQERRENTDKYWILDMVHEGRAPDYRTTAN